MLSNRASSGWTVDRVLSSAKIDANSRVEAVNLVVHFFFPQSKLELCTRRAMCFACILLEFRIHPSKSRRSWRIYISTNISRGCLSKAILQVLLGIARQFDINTYIHTCIQSRPIDARTLLFVKVTITRKQRTRLVGDTGRKSNARLRQVDRRAVCNSLPNLATFRFSGFLSSSEYIRTRTELTGPSFVAVSTKLLYNS